MSVEFMQTMSFILYIMAAVFFVIGIVLFFVLNIPRIFSDITGATARKAIENIRQKNEESGDKVYRSSHVNIARGRVTDKISLSGRLKPRDVDMGVSMETEKFDTEILARRSEETTVLSENIADNTFSIDEDMIFTASSEIIE